MDLLDKIPWTHRTCIVSCGWLGGIRMTWVSPWTRCFVCGHLPIMSNITCISMELPWNYIYWFGLVYTGIYRYIPKDNFGESMDLRVYGYLLPPSTTSTIPLPGEQWNIRYVHGIYYRLMVYPWRGYPLEYRFRRIQVIRRLTTYI